MPEQFIADLAASFAAADGQRFRLWRCHERTGRAFLACQTQWRFAAGVAGLVYAGLDYAAAKVALDAFGFSIDERLFRGLQVMEGAALAELNRGA